MLRVLWWSDWMINCDRNEFHKHIYAFFYFSFWPTLLPKVRHVCLKIGKMLHLWLHKDSADSVFHHFDKIPTKPLSLIHKVVFEVVYFHNHSLPSHYIWKEHTISSESEEALHLPCICKPSRGALILIFLKSRLLCHCSMGNKRTIMLNEAYILANLFQTIPITIPAVGSACCGYEHVPMPSLWLLTLFIHKNSQEWNIFYPSKDISAPVAM